MAQAPFSFFTSIFTHPSHPHPSFGSGPHPTSPDFPLTCLLCLRHRRRPIGGNRACLDIPGPIRFAVARCCCRARFGPVRLRCQVRRLSAMFGRILQLLLPLLSRDATQQALGPPRRVPRRGTHRWGGNVTFGWMGRMKRCFARVPKDFKGVFSSPQLYFQDSCRCLFMLGNI